MKLTAILLALVLLVSLFGCSKQETSTGETTATTASGATTATSSETTAPEFSYTLDTSPIDIHVFYRSRWWPEVIDEGSVPAWEESAVYKHIQEMTGVSMKYDVPVAEENEALGPMIAAGNYPDMIAFGSYQNTYYQQMREAGLVYSLTELSKQYAPAIFDKNLIAKTQIQWFGDDKGELYHYSYMEGNKEGLQAYIDVGLPPTSGEQIIYVRKDILKAWNQVTGKEDLAAWADFDSMIHFAHENYPAVDTIKIDSGDPLEGGVWGRHFTAAFGGHVSFTYPDFANQKILHRLKDAKIIDYMKWLNGLYREGIITDTMLSETAQIKSEKYTQGNYAILIGATFYTNNTINKTITENDGNTDRNYIPCSQVSYNDKNYYTQETIASKGTGALVITKNAKKPDRCIRLLEYLLSDDGQVNGALGVEGVTWEMKDGQKVLKPDVAKEITTDLLAYVKKYKLLGACTFYVKMSTWAKYCDNFLVPPGEEKEMTKGMIGPYMVNAWDVGFCDLRGDVPNPDDQAIRTKVGELQATYATKMVSAKSDAEFQSLLDEFFTEANKVGLEKLEGIWTQNYLSNCQRLEVTPWKDLQIPLPAFEGYKLVRKW